MPQVTPALCSAVVASRLGLLATCYAVRTQSAATLPSVPPGLCLEHRISGRIGPDGASEQLAFGDLAGGNSKGKQESEKNPGSSAYTVINLRGLKNQHAGVRFS